MTGNPTVGDEADAAPILVTSIEARSGKTAIALALALEAEARGADVGYMRPKGTRLESAVETTPPGAPELARELLDLDAELHELEPIVYSSAFVAEAIRGQEAPDAIRDRVRERSAALSARHDRIVLEGSSAATGNVVELSDADVAELLDATVLLVTPYDQPADADAVLEAADRFDDRLGGVLFNSVPDAAFDDVVSGVVPFLEARGIRTFGTVPLDGEMASVTVSELADELNAEPLTVPSDDAIERIVVGAMAVSDAPAQLRRSRDAAVIVDAGRTELQTVALESSGVACLLVTGSRRPSKVVLERAEEVGVPVLSVPTDTGTTIDRTEGIIRIGRSCDARAVERMRKLLRDYADVDAILAP